MSVFHKLALPLFFIALLGMRQGFAIAEPISDVRILIDVSGSMKVNDPDNLRTPAMKMLIGLMPEDSRAGVWTFAKMTNMLVPWKPVDEAWRQQAMSQVGNIHSFGLFTDIEQVLQTATSNLKTAREDRRRSLILLSDGYVDIQPNQKESEASRQRILDNIVPKLKKAGVQVHTVALSDKADKALLQAISSSTDGWHKQANTADDLQRIFLHMFEQSTSVDTVPLAENQFNIDAAITQMTVLAFRQANTPATELTMPSGERLTQGDVSETVRWLSEETFDLITIDNPATGRWQINAELDPDNRVMVVTDLQLNVSELPSNILQGETFDFEATLTDQGELIQREAFLSLVEGTLAHQRFDEVRDMPLSRLSGEAIYRATLGSDFGGGRNDVIVTIKSATFERQRRQSVKVLAGPVYVETAQLPEDVRSHRVDVHVEPRLLKSETLTVTTLLRDLAGNEWPYDLSQVSQNLWQVTLTDLEPMQDYTLSLHVKGENLEGRQVFIQPDSINLVDVSDLMASDNQSESGTGDNLNIFEEVGEEAAEQEGETTVDLLAVEADTELLAEDDAVMEEGGLSDTMKLLIGNALILVLLIAGIVWWRKQTNTSVLAGDLI
jgi:hypothetical protein